MLLRRIRADTDDDRVDSLEPREGVLEAARLDGSARGAILRIEEEHHDPAPLLGQGEERAVVGGGCEIWSLIAGRRHGKQGVR
jgi:hypothetical protein